MTKINYNSAPRKESTQNELLEIYINSYVKYQSLKECLLNKNITEQQLEELINSAYTKELLNKKTKELSNTLGLTITKSETVETAQSLIDRILK